MVENRDTKSTSIVIAVIAVFTFVNSYCLGRAYLIQAEQAHAIANVKVLETQIKLLKSRVAVSEEKLDDRGGWMQSITESVKRKTADRWTMPDMVALVNAIELALQEFIPGLKLPKVERVSKQVVTPEVPN